MGAIAALLPLCQLMAQEDRVAPGQPLGQLSNESIVAASISATARVAALDARGDTLSVGSAFFIRRDGVLVTNWHVLRGASRAVVLRNGHAPLTEVSVIAADSMRDVAVLSVTGGPFPTLPIASTSPKAGARVVVIGSPLGLSETVTEGIVSAYRNYGGRELVQISAAISPGSSGGPVLDARGRVFAISTMYLEGGQQLNFAVPVYEATNLLDSASEKRSVGAIFSRHDQPESGANALSRTWAVVQRLRYSGSAHSQEIRRGYLVVGSKVQLLIFDQGDGFVLPLNLVRIASDGAMTITSDVIDYNGSATRNGFWVYSHLPTKVPGEYLEWTLTGWPGAIAPSADMGAYVVEGSSHRYINGTRGVAVTERWQGEMAFGAVNLKTAISLYMRSDMGAEIQCSTLSDQEGDTFRTLCVGSGPPVTISGVFGSGRMTVTWSQGSPYSDYRSGEFVAVRR